MRYLKLYLLLSVFWLSVSCINNEYTELEVGNYWLNDFQQAPIQNARLYKGKLYCNSINQQTGDFLYCLDLIDGRVKWKVPVDNFASAPVLINDKAIYYTTFVGHTYCVSLDGIILNSIKFSNSYSGQRINPFNGNLIINSVVNGAKEFDRDSLKEVFHYEFRGKDGLSALSEPVFYDSLIIFGNVEIDSVTGEKGLVAIGQNNKQRVWQAQVPRDIKSKFEGLNKDIYLEVIDDYLIALDFFDRDKVLFVIDCKDGKVIELNKKRRKSFENLVQFNKPKKQRFSITTEEGVYSVELKPVDNTTEMEVIINRE